MQTFTQWLGFGRRSRVHDEEIVELTEQFYVTLDASFARVPPPRDGMTDPTARRVADMLRDEHRSWTAAYEIEQLLVQLYDDDTVAAELDLRAMEAAEVLRKNQADHYTARAEALRQSKDPSAPRLRRILLARLVNDLQWRYTVNEARRRYSKVITSRAGMLFVAALVLFAAVVAAKVFYDVRLMHDDLKLFAFAGLAGAWGATFSMLATLRSRLDASSLDDLKLIRPRVMLASRTLIGAGAACILYFFIMSGLLGGTAFPRLTTPPSGPGDAAASAPAATAPALPLPDTQLALLVVWCFIAGFSEQLVPGLLARTEARATAREDARPSSDRYRPTSSGDLSSTADGAAQASKTTRAEPTAGGGPSPGEPGQGGRQGDAHTG